MRPGSNGQWSDSVPRLRRVSASWRLTDRFRSSLGRGYERVHPPTPRHPFPTRPHHDGPGHRSCAYATLSACLPDPSCSSGRSGSPTTCSSRVRRSGIERRCCRPTGSTHSPRPGCSASPDRPPRADPCSTSARPGGSWQLSVRAVAPRSSCGCSTTVSSVLSPRRPTPISRSVCCPISAVAPGSPAVRATRCDGGWRLDGHAPWATSWGIAERFSVSAVTDDDPTDRRLVRVMVPGHDVPGLTATPLHLPVFASTGTMALDVDGLEVFDADVVDVQPLATWRAGDRASASVGQPAVLGVADRAIRLLSDRSDADARSAAERLRVELDAAWDRDDELLPAFPTLAQLDPGDADDVIAAASDHRAACLHLARRATSAFLAASGGGGMDLSHPAQRLMREADFYVIQAQTADGRAATLRSI